MRTIFLSVVAMFFSNIIFSQQTLKFGHIDSNDLLTAMPEREAAKKSLETFATELEKQLKDMSSEYEIKLAEYSKLTSTTSAVIKKTKEDELVSMQQKMQNFQQDAQEELKNKESELLKPVIDKAKKAIEDVGKENGYLYIFDTAVGVLLFKSDKSEDILPLVKKKLGIVEIKK